MSWNHWSLEISVTKNAFVMLSPMCAFSNVSSSGLPQRMTSYTGCICLAFPHCVYSNASSNRLPENRHCHIGCICLPFLHCAFSNVSSNRLLETTQSHKACIYLTIKDSNDQRQQNELENSEEDLSVLIQITRQWWHKLTLQVCSMQWNVHKKKLHCFWLHMI